MNIQDFINRIKPPSSVVEFDEKGEVDSYPQFKNIYLALVIILVATLSFGIGRLSVVGEREPVRIEYNPDVSTNIEATNPKQISNSNAQTATAVKAVQSDQTVVGSSKGTKYHYLHCSGAKQISEKNKITFSSTAAAEAAGYTLAANCSPR